MFILEHSQKGCRGGEGIVPTSTTYRGTKVMPYVLKKNNNPTFVAMATERTGQESAYKNS